MVSFKGLHNIVCLHTLLSGCALPLDRKCFTQSPTVSVTASSGVFRYVDEDSNEWSGVFRYVDEDSIECSGVFRYVDEDSNECSGVFR